MQPAPTKPKKIMHALPKNRGIFLKVSKITWALIISKSFKNYLGFDNFRKELASFLFDCVLTFLRRLLSLRKIQRMRLEQ